MDPAKDRKFSRLALNLRGVFGSGQPHFPHDENPKDRDSQP
jgi:hypothetical protein